MGRRQNRSEVRKLRIGHTSESHPAATYGRNCRCEKCRGKRRPWPGATYILKPGTFTDAAVYVGSSGVSFECGSVGNYGRAMTSEHARECGLRVWDRGETPDERTYQAPVKDNDRALRDATPNMNCCERCEGVVSSGHRYCKACEGKVAPELLSAGWDAQKINRWFAGVDVFDEATA